MASRPRSDRRRQREKSRSATDGHRLCRRGVHRRSRDDITCNAVAGKVIFVPAFAPRLVYFTVNAAGSSSTASSRCASATSSPPASPTADRRELVHVLVQAAAERSVRRRHRGDLARPARVGHEPHARAAVDLDRERPDQHQARGDLPREVGRQDESGRGQRQRLRPGSRHPPGREPRPQPDDDRLRAAALDLLVGRRGGHTPLRTRTRARPQGTCRGQFWMALPAGVTTHQGAPKAALPWPVVWPGAVSPANV
jgi:hypothetical protein